MITIRQATLADKPQIFTFLQSAYPKRWQYKIPARWEWAFENNPFRDPEKLPIWIAVDEATGEVVGQSCALIEPMVVHGQTYQVGWGVDFRVLPTYRGQGLGTQLQKANNAAHPIFMSLSMATAARSIKSFIGMEPLTPVPAFMKIIRHDPASVQKTLENRLKPIRWLPQSIRTSRLPNLFAAGLSWRDRIHDLRRIPNPSPSIAIQPVKHFDQSFDQLFNTLTPKYYALIKRDAVYLNWKFKQQPHMNHFAFLAQKTGKPCGYLILRRSQPPERNAGIIVDLFTDPEDRLVIDALIAKAVAVFRAQGTTYISAASSVPMIQDRLTAMGFKQNKTTTPMIRSQTPFPQNGWLLSKGDHDWDQYPLA